MSFFLHRFRLSYHQERLFSGFCNLVPCYPIAAVSLHPNLLPAFLSFASGTLLRTGKEVIQRKFIQRKGSVIVDYSSNLSFCFVERSTPKVPEPAVCVVYLFIKVDRSWGSEIANHFLPEVLMILQTLLLSHCISLLPFCSPAGWLWHWSLFSAKLWTMSCYMWTGLFVF